MLRFNGQSLVGTTIAPDSIHIPRFVQDCLGLDPQACFDTLVANTQWNDRTWDISRYRGHELARTKAYYVQPRAEDGALPRYGFPGFQYAQMATYHPLDTFPALHELVGHITHSCTYNSEPVHVNHAILTHYVDESDNIGWHNDKVQDLVPNAPIISLSFGASRSFSLGRPKKGKPEETEQSTLEAGDLFILGPRTNTELRHAVLPTANPCGPRISLVLRDIATHVTPATAQAKANKTEEQRAKKRQKASAEDGQGDE